MYFLPSGGHKSSHISILLVLMHTYTRLKRKLGYILTPSHTTKRVLFETLNNANLSLITNIHFQLHTFKVTKHYFLANRIPVLTQPLFLKTSDSHGDMLCYEIWYVYFLISMTYTKELCRFITYYVLGIAILQGISFFIFITFQILDTQF